MAHDVHPAEYEINSLFSLHPSGRGARERALFVTGSKTEPGARVSAETVEKSADEPGSKPYQPADDDAEMQEPENTPEPEIPGKPMSDMAPAGQDPDVAE